MSRHICVINCPDNAIEMEESEFITDTEFIHLPPETLWNLPRQHMEPLVVFFNLEGLPHISRKRFKTLARAMRPIILIAMVTPATLAHGITALDGDISDFMVLPARKDTFDIYVKRAMDRIGIQNDLLFKNQYYKSRYNLTEQKYKQLFDEVPCFIFTLNKDYVITDSNRKFNTYFGKNIGGYCFGICKNRDDPCRCCPVRQTFEDGQNHASESEIISSDGVKHVVLSWTAPLRDRHGDIHQVLVMMTDITEVRRLEDHLASLGVMIGSISHGIKGLLTSLDSGMYLLNSGYQRKDMERIQEGLTISQQITDRIKKLVLDILYYTKTRSPVWRKVSVRQFVDEVILPIVPAAEKNKIRFTVNVQCETLDDLFEIDDKSLQSAFINILENGIDACVEAGNAPSRHLLFHCRIKRDKVIFLIKDNGRGMDGETLKNIFTIFFSSKGKKGTGLGLYITNKVIEQHSGTIKVRSTPATGTKFLIKLPRSIPATSKSRATE